MSDPWHISLFGGLRAQRDEQVITRFKYQKVGGLLAYLACHLRQMHAREVLVEIFWPEHDPTSARSNLSTALSSLRNQFEPPGTPAGAVLRADRYSVGLNPMMVTTDVAQFEAAIREAERTNSPTERRQSWERAVGLYQGRLLSGYYEEWILPEEERLAGLFFDTVSALLMQLEQESELIAALHYARQAVSVDPLREEAHQHLIRLLFATGQPGAALRQYRELERLLDEQMGEEPSAPLRALARQIEKQSQLPLPPLLTSSVAPVSTVRFVPPAGQPATLTFLLTDISGATAPVEREGGIYKAALETHDTTLRAQFTVHGGQEVRATGNGFVVAFQGATNAVTCAVACQQALAEQVWPPKSGPLAVRMALHTGDVEFTDGGYRGPALHLAERILTAGHGGQVLVSQVTAELVRRALPEERRLVDLGIYSLRDVLTPERLYQVDFPGAPQEGFPALAAEARPQARLPVQVTRFFGRETEIARITQLLRGEPTRLLTLSGAGGTGKTRLAIEAAGRMAAAYQGAVWLVPLADLSDASLIPSAILDALRLPRSPQREPLEQIVEALARQPSLLVLDNFEHLVEAGIEIVQTLLSRVPSLTCLVTSRQRLGLSAEREFPVLPLPIPNGPDTPERLSLYDSVRLFVDRAQAVMPHFQVTNHNAPSVAELCDRLEGIPLAIELAAARAQALTPSQMLSQLQNRFEFLSTRKRDVSDRHRTLRAAVEWSYRLLSWELQRFFCRLSVFRGGWSVEAAEAVCEEGLALDYLALLQESSLVLSEESGQGMRFRMLETLREYGQEQLSPQERAVLAQEHLRYFMQLSLANTGDYYGGPRGEKHDLLEAEIDNLRAALVWSRQAEGDAESGLWLAMSLNSFASVRGYWREVREAIEQALARAPSAPVNLRMKALRGLALIVSRMGDREHGKSLMAQSLLLAQESGNEVAAAEILADMGRTDEALALFQKNSVDWGILWCQDIKSRLGVERGEYVQSRVWFEQALETARREGSLGPQRGYLFRLGRIALFQGEYNQARAFFEECLSLARTIRDQAFVGYSHRNIGYAELAEGRYAEGRTRFEESLTIMRRLSDDLHAALSLCGLGEITLRLGDNETARALSEEAYRICERKGQGNEVGMALSLDILGALALRGQDSAQARALFSRSLRLKQADENPYHIAAGLENLAVALANEPEKAVILLGAANAWRGRVGAPRRPIDRADYEALLENLRAALSAETFSSVWEAGEAMPLEQAVAYALEE